MPKYYPKAVKAFRERAFNSYQNVFEPEPRDFFREEVSKLLDDLEVIARKEVQLYNASGRNQVALGDHPVFNLIVKFRRRVNV